MILKIALFTALFTFSIFYCLFWADSIDNKIRKIMNKNKKNSTNDIELITLNDGFNHDDIFD